MSRVVVVPDLLVLLSTVLRLAVVFGLGTLIGFERQWRQHTAGLRTNVLVATGAAAFADLGLRPLVNYLNRRPLDESSSEALYSVHAACAPAAVSELRDLLYVVLEAARYPIREIETESDSEEQVELTATLQPIAAAPAELDAVVAAPNRAALVKSATWTVETEG